MSGKAARELDRVRIEKADLERQIAELRSDLERTDRFAKTYLRHKEAAEADKARLSEEIRTVLKSVLHHFGPEGAHKITSDCLSVRAALSGSGAGGWRTMDGPVPTYECEFHLGQPVKLANPYAEDDPSRIFYVVGIEWEYRMVPGHGWNITVSSKGDIEKRYGATDGFGPSDLLPAAPTATGEAS